jgi:RNA-directed DNA polymerase
MKQVLEPICEARFHDHSYGFRPLRSAKHVLARAAFLVNKNGLHYVVDIDIQSFFDTIAHGKLLKQCWSLGIQDKKILCILSKM